jgi:hypothetical protein
MYFLGLNVLPCSDVAESQQVVEHTELSQDLEHEDHEDFCSPFCQCSCCSISVITYVMNSIDLESNPTIEILTVSFYKNPQYDVYQGSLLQPPQLNS